MNLSTIHNIFRDLATKHKAIKSFYTGLASEFNTDFDMSYPALVVDPVSITKSTREGFFVNNWNVVLEVIDILSEERTMTEVNETLDSTHRILDQIITRFITDYNDKNITYDNQEERVDWQIQDNYTVLPLIDDEEKSHTGWQVSFTITEQVRFSTCCNDDVFDA